MVPYCCLNLLPDGVREKMGIDKFCAEVLPQEKSSKIEILRAENRIAWMTGEDFHRVISFWGRLI